MSGRELEKLLELVDNNSLLNTGSHEELLRYITDHRAEILAELQERGEATLTPPNGQSITIRKAA